MAKEIRGVIANTVTRMNAIVCDTGYDGTTAFRQDVEALDGADLTQTRTYCVVDTGRREDMGTMGVSTSPSEVIADLEVHLTYRRAVDVYTMQLAIAEDLDRIRYTLEDASGLDQTSAANLWMREVGDPSLFRGDEPDDPILVVIPIRCTYRPTF